MWAHIKLVLGKQFILHLRPIRSSTIQKSCFKKILYRTIQCNGKESQHEKALKFLNSYPIHFEMIGYGIYGIIKMVNINLSYNN